MRPILFFIVIATLSHSVLADESASSLIDQVEQAIVEQTNDFREKSELAPVVVDDALRSAALKFANFMARTDKYGHHADGSTPAQRAKAAGYEYCVIRENIAYRINTGEVTKAGLVVAFVQGWIDSPPHRENMLADYVTNTGVAVATDDQHTYYAVQLFGRPKSAAVKIRVFNDSGEARRLIIEANDSVDEFELAPRTTVTMTRCFPSTLKLDDGSNEIRLTETARLVIGDQGLKREEN